MKNQNFLLPSKKGTSYKNLLQIFAVLLITAFTMSRVLGRENELIRIVNKESMALLPDSVFVIEEDTIFGYIDGLDSIFLIVEDTIGLDLSLIHISEPTRPY